MKTIQEPERYGRDEEYPRRYRIVKKEGYGYQCPICHEVFDHPEKAIECYSQGKGKRCPDTRCQELALGWGMKDRNGKLMQKTYALMHIYDESRGRGGCLAEEPVEIAPIVGRVYRRHWVCPKVRCRLGTVVLDPKCYHFALYLIFGESDLAKIKSSIDVAIEKNDRPSVYVVEGLNCFIAQAPQGYQFNHNDDEYDRFFILKKKRRKRVSQDVHKEGH